MARQIPEERFEHLVSKATEVFISRGFRQTLMADIAKAVGVSKGTLYLYVVSKEALFALCLREAVRDEPIPVPDELPVQAPPEGELTSFLAEQLSSSPLRTLLEAIRAPRDGEVRAELRGIFGELYDLLDQNCRAIKLIDRCWDHPELGKPWEILGREAPRARLVEYLEGRMRAGQLRPHPDPALLARVALEICVTWAVHIKWDHNPQMFDAENARKTAIHFAVEGILAWPEISA